MPTRRRTLSRFLVASTTLFVAVLAVGALAYGYPHVRGIVGPPLKAVVGPEQALTDRPAAAGQATC
jgi:hypothetical protein